MDQLVREAAQKAKGILNFGSLPDLSWQNEFKSGVTYLGSTAGSQVYSANSLVSR